MHHMLDSLALSHEAPLAEVPAGLKTTAKHYQLQGLRWMLDREQKGDAANRSGLAGLEATINCT